jgi:hypothetical protein
MWTLLGEWQVDGWDELSLVVKIGNNEVSVGGEQYVKKICDMKCKLSQIVHGSEEARYILKDLHCYFLSQIMI